MRVFTVLIVVAALGGFAPAQEKAQEKKSKGLDLNSLPAAVRATIQANLNGGEIRNISKEKEDGVEQYEVESVLQGKRRDFEVDSRCIRRKAALGKITVVETFSKPGQPLMYEAGYTDKAGKKHDVLVKADGTETKE